jgi:hypothetical protein
MCGQLDRCEVVDGRRIIDKSPRSGKNVLSSAERKILEVFRAHGPLLTNKDAIRLSAEAGINETTTHIYLSISPLLRRLANGIYSVVGANVSPKEVEDMAKTVVHHRARVMQDFGLNADGSGLWASYRISSGVLSNGIVSIPSGIKQYISADDYDLHTLDGTHVGQLRVGEAQMWGLGPLFRRRGGEEGDHLRIRLLFNEEKAIVEMSQEPFED